MSATTRFELARMRERLEATDRELLDLVAKRAAQVRDIWAWKEARNMPLYDPAREDRILARWLAGGRAAGLETGALRHLFYALLEATAPASAAGDFVRLHRPGLAPGASPPERLPGTGPQEHQQQQEAERPEDRDGHGHPGHGIAHVAGTTGRRG